LAIVRVDELGINIKVKMEGAMCISSEMWLPQQRGFQRANYGLIFSVDMDTKMT
jgi:hypothetical protein